VATPVAAADFARSDGGTLSDGGARSGTRAPHPGTRTVDELAGDAAVGDRRAFDELVRRTYADTYTLALRLVGDGHDARDVVQEAYLRAFRGLHRFRGDARFSTWMHRITANCASTHLGRRRRHRHDELDDDIVAEDGRAGHDPVGRAEQALLRERLHRALRTLPPRLRAVVVLRDIYDLPHQAIAAELGISETAAKVRLHRARRRLRDDVVLRAAATDGEPPRAL
jgi:RNA polymerase sigma-70 factor (ECF subfamily)